MQSIDIVNLIETNPITKLSNAYNNKFLMKIKDNFSEMEQQLFVSSFYCYLNFNQTNDFVIDLDNVWKWLGFSVKIKAKTLLEKYFMLDKDYRLLLCDIVKQKIDSRGGHNKETIMLTVKTFKLFCIKADTKRANEIHEYFIKLEEMLYQVVQEESNELKLQLEQVKTENIQNTIIIKSNTILIETNKKDFDKKISREREQFLMREFGTIEAMIYIIKVKTFENGEYIIKIGESRRGIQARYNEHRTKYGSDILLLDCFAVKRSKDLEFYIHNHADVRIYQVFDLDGHENEKELFRIGNGLSYSTLLQIVNTNIKRFNEHTNDENEMLKRENEMLKSLITRQLAIYSETSENTIEPPPIENKVIQEMAKQIQKLEQTNKEILDKLNASQTKTTTNFNQSLITLGPRLQKINPETLTLNKVYESIAECLKEYNFTVKRPSIVKSIEDNTVYHGYRWAFVDRNADPSTIVNLEPTKETKIQNLGYIAKLNQDKTEIINVYLDRKTAAISNGYRTSASLDVPVKKETITNGHYYMLYDDCSDALQSKFIELHGNPVLYKAGIGQYNTENQLVKEFVCKYDCIKQLKISDKTLAKALDKDIPYNGWIFKSIGQKLQGRMC